MKKAALVALSCLVCLGLGCTLPSKKIKVSKSNTAETIECNGQNVAVQGSSNRLFLQGKCPKVDVSGGSNVVVIEMVDDVGLQGDNNNVIWLQAISRQQPNVVERGQGNTFRHGTLRAEEAQSEAGAAADGTSDQEGVVVAKAGGGRYRVDFGGLMTSELDDSGRAHVRIGPMTVDGVTDGRAKVKIGPMSIDAEVAGAGVSTGGRAVVINDNELTRTIDCRGGDVVVNGNENTLRLNGECGRVAVNGNRNTLKVDAAASIFTPGNENEVVWGAGTAGQAPRILNPGTDNEIRQSKR